MAARQMDFAHIGPETLAGRYLRRFWHPIHRSADLVAGRPVRAKLMNEYFTLWRGESGEAHMVEDACPHRQTSLALGWVAGDNIRCFYHGWEFSGSGQCMAMPAEKKSFAGKVQVRSYPVREYLGLIFVYLGEGDPPAFVRYPELEGSEGGVTVHQHPVPCNYFQRIENDLDELHIHFVHRVTADRIGLDEMPEIKVTETPYGSRREGHRKSGGRNVTRTGHFIMPNISMVDLPPSPAHNYWTITASWRVPIDDETMMTFAIRLRPGKSDGKESHRIAEPDPMTLTEEILAGKIRVQDLDPKYPGLFNVQDNVAMAGQGRIVDRSKDRLGQSDVGVILIRKLYDRELRALAQGKPLKKWKRPDTKLDFAISEVGKFEEV